MSKQYKKTILSLIFLAALLVGCALMDSSKEYRHETPSEYYLYLPAKYNPDRTWTIFMGLHGEGETGRDCFKTWQPYADEVGYVLVCPTLLVEDGELATFDSERRISGVLTEVFKNVVVEERFFLAGFSAGAEFALAYAYRYPQAITGVSVISAWNFPQPLTQALDLPVLITVGEQDTGAVEAAQEFDELLHESSFTARLVVLPGVDHRISDDAIRLTLGFLRQVSRKIIGGD